MAEKYTYADVIIDPEDPRVEIGKEYYFGDFPKEALEYANKNGRGALLEDIDLVSNFPFLMENFDESAPCIIRKKEYTENDIITDVSDPRLKDAIGKTVYVAHKLYSSVVDNANNNDSANKGVLVNLGYDPSHPFEVHTELGFHWDRIILSKNQPPRKKYVPFNLSKEEDRNFLRNKWVRKKDTDELWEDQILSFGSDEVLEEPYASLNMGSENAETLFKHFEFLDGTPCGRLVED